MKVKICGITNIEDALKAVELGIDALGFIFAKSPRKVEPEKAAGIIRSLPLFIKTVGVFVNEEPNRIRQIVDLCGLDIIQFHGDEPPEVLAEFAPRAIKAFRLKDESSLEPIKSYQGKVRATLLDTYSDNKFGGTGKTFDWGLAIKAKAFGIPLILSGGLSPDNIQEAIRAVQPYAVDVNSGVEEGPGKKDHILMTQLMENIRRVSI
ncbi:N-(5'-phosphoribosyl)anthranilate isomerase [uncultured Desulfobacterium sp.]|uniref:N-(5'-phosphoribosyl)anthranilate isomerase n=1 Tax=uncultured Desulfobacterium sp. TaxID=201089 RepID=A0A445N3Q6_9BACT|nr:N-(5'-phosphoribosyl)anthranilate isomerase [uncultured Desulfobacterium sp.]